MTAHSEATRRAALWAVGTALILCGFFLRRGLQRERSAAGTAVRLFSVRSQLVRLYASPDGRNWLVSVAPNPTAPTGASQLLSGLAWAPWSPRVLRPLSAPGSYLLTGSGLRRVWNVQANGWLDARQLFGLKDAYTQLGHPSSFDLHSRRAHILRTEFSPEIPDFPNDLPRSHSSLYRLSGASPEVPTDASGESADDAPARPDLALPEVDGWRGGDDDTLTWGRVNDREVIFNDIPSGEEKRPGLYGLSDDDAPRSLYLTVAGEPLAISGDGRTLFFEREHALWRLDLRKPLPQLLDDVKVPALPDPPQ